MKEYTKWQNFKMTENEWQLLRVAAKKHGMTISEFIRYCIQKESRKQDSE